MRAAYIDRLRIFIILLLIPYHAARMFDSPDFYLTLPSRPLSWEPFTRIFDFFGMPVLFVAGGFACARSLARRGATGVIVERARRLLIPLLFGLVLLIPPVSMIASAAHGGALSLERFLEIGDLSGFDGRFTPAHLWFLIFLFFYCAAAAPLSRATSRVATALGKPPPWLVFWGGLAAAALAELLGGVIGFSYPSPSYFLVFFLYGHLLGAEQGRLPTPYQLSPGALALALVTTPLWLWARLYSLEHGSAMAALPPVLAPLFAIDNALVGWPWTILLLGLFERFANGPPGKLDGWRDWAMVAYLGHMTALVAIAAALPAANEPPLLRWAAISGLSFAALWLLYAAVRRVAALRFFFGLKSINAQLET